MSKTLMDMPGGGVKNLSADELHSWVHEVMPRLGFIGIHRDSLEQVEQEMAAFLNVGSDDIRSYLERLHGEVQRLLEANAPFSHEQLV